MIGLIFGCPMGNELDDCPLRKIRKLPINERIKAYDKMPLQERKSIQRHHEECLARREGKL